MPRFTMSFDDADPGHLDALQDSHSVRIVDKSPFMVLLEGESEEVQKFAAAVPHSQLVPEVLYPVKSARAELLGKAKIVRPSTVDRVKRSR